ncbi:MAG TPA: FAD-binding oxidoreductase, partial [Candidatus Binatia bacterium]|nr:FAD-binding oxidoreductase [Candidatus Binatia bacterium]
LEGVEHCLDALAGVVAEAEIDCDLTLPGCWELVHRDAPDTRPLWRDGETWLCVEDTVAGGTIDPGALVAGLARAAIRAGATLHEQAAVHGIEPGQPLRLRVGAGSLTADRAFVALNAYTGTLLAIPVRLTPALTLAVSTDVLEPGAIAALGLSGGSPFYTLDMPYLWGRMTRDGRLVLGAGLVMNDERDVAALRLHGPNGAASLARLEARIARFHPVLAGAAVRERWGGPIAFTPDRTPILSRLPRAPDVIVSAGCAGHGIALGVRVGQLVADAFAGGEDLPRWGALPSAPATRS